MGRTERPRASARRSDWTSIPGRVACPRTRAYAVRSRSRSRKSAVAGAENVQRGAAWSSAVDSCPKPFGGLRLLDGRHHAVRICGGGARYEGRDRGEDEGLKRDRAW